jgi:hypothetical protein
MARLTDTIGVYLEVGQKRTFAGALDWPGWCRSGRDEAAALVALVEYAPRYAKIFSRPKLAFTPPDDLGAFAVVERLAGNSTTDFGAPGLAPTQDADPFDEAERERSEAILAAIWRAFDRAVGAAEGRDLRKGPRGGGRDRAKIVRHVLGADAGYLHSLAQKFSQHDKAPLSDELTRTRAAIRAALAAGTRGEIPGQRPRGGKIWTPRYLVRRVAWHTLDHAWEIEDRITSV